MSHACKHCGKPTRWALTPRGRWVLLAQQPDVEGTYRFNGRRAATRLVGVELETARVRGHHLHQLHATECTPHPVSSPARPPAGRSH